ncbi:MAG: GDSL-type esterase/lipase family protein [Flavitalea sp.]
MSISRFFLSIALVFMISGVEAQQAINKLPYYPYFNSRDGLQHSLDIFSANKNATVAFLGGSITFNAGWRDMVCDYLKRRFPATQFHFIAAGISSLGSLPHAFRLQRDVLDKGKVDLLFVEAAVNDHANKTDSLIQLQSLEGIVRHARNNNPAMDIALMSFADEFKSADFDNGIVPTEVVNHELIAEHYRLPSINLAKEVHDRISNNEFSWKADFKDLHPSPFGQQLYFNTIKAMLSACFDSAGLKHEMASLPLPAPLMSAPIDKGRFVSITKVKADKNWKWYKDWTPSDSLPTRVGFVHVPLLETTTPGASFTYRFRGSAVGLSLLTDAEAGTIVYSIDNGQANEINLVTEWSNSLHLPWFVLLGSGLGPEKHLLKMSFAGKAGGAPNSQACRILNLMVNDY